MRSQHINPMAQPKISAFFQKLPKTSSNQPHLFTVVDQKSKHQPKENEKQRKLTKLLSLTPVNPSCKISPLKLPPALEENDDIISVTPEAVVRKLFGNNPILPKEKNTRKRISFKDKRNENFSRTKPLKRHSVETISPNSKHPSKKISNHKNILVEETQFEATNLNLIASPTIIKETQLKNFSPVDETCIDANSFVSHSPTVIKETQLEDDKKFPIVEETLQLAAEKSLGINDSLTVIKETQLENDKKFPIVEETLQLAAEKSLGINDSLTVIKETQLENDKKFPIVEETLQLAAEKSLGINESLTVIKETQLETEKDFCSPNEIEGTPINKNKKSVPIVLETLEIDLTDKVKIESMTVIKETQLDDNRKILVEETIPMDLNENVNENESLTIVKETQLNHVDDENLSDEELLKYFDRMSPFKKENEFVNKKKTVGPFLSGLGRHVVTQIEILPNEITLHVRSEENFTTRICKLREFWTQTNVKVNDVVNILSSFDSNHVAVIDNLKGLIIVNPDHLISGTSVVSSLFCTRKSVLAEKFRGSDPASFAMVCGSLIHQIFQEAMLKQAFKTNEITLIAKEIVKHNSNLHTIYASGFSETEIMEEIEKYIPQMRSWFDTYIIQPVKTSQNYIKITNVHDIEENIWSPRYGVKGKVDLTVEVEIHKREKRVKKIMPLELKTGKSSFSAEHSGQVMLYSMMSSDRRPDPEAGLLVYLRDGQTKEIPAEHHHKRGLIQLRNELVQFLDQKVDDIEDIPKFPETLNSDRLCSKCPYATICCLYKSLEVPNRMPADHDMHKLIPQFTSHLRNTHIKYFLKWQHLINLESSSAKNFNFLNGIYCQTSDERLEEGYGVTQIKIKNKNSISETSNGLFRITFNKTDNRMIFNDIATGDMVIISCEATKEFAIASGSVTDNAEKFIIVEIDKNLGLRPDFYTTTFRVDKYSAGNIAMAMAAGNLARLMENDDKSAKLRRLIIDREQPMFMEKLSKEVLKGKKILRELNKSQTRSVLRSLSCEDYLLIKGMPGTGKTSTIVALVRLLDLLGHSVLLTSYTHTAVDNILLKLKTHGVEFIRLGKLSKIHPEIQDYSAEKLVQNLTSVEDLKIFYESKKIFATTCLGSNHISFHKKTFDFCIVDEAAQIMQIACLGPLFHANRFILIGDPLQLPPLVQNRVARRQGMDQSLFSLLDCPTATIELNVQYRMNKVIMALANELVYNGALTCGTERVSLSTITIPKGIPSLSGIFSEALDDAVIFINTDGIPAPESSHNFGLRNETEATLVLRLVQQFNLLDLKLEEIGVISAYSAQVNCVRELMLKNNLSIVEVNTVDQYQGRDKDIILVSFVRCTSNIDKLGEILFDMRRLNVAITRAKHKVIFIGSVTTLRHYPPIKKLIDLTKGKIVHANSTLLNEIF